MIPIYINLIVGKNTDWLKNLKSQIIEDRDKKNFDDIVKCYENDILRAGFVMAWLMLVESLKRKVVELADKDVKVAVKEKENIQKIEEAMRSNDEAIINAALACDLISAEEKGVLDMLWGKRCIMSHPYMPEVKENDFRYMVENLVSISLGKTVLWSQSMIEDFFEGIKDSTFIIPNTDEQRKELANKTLVQIPDKNLPFFWKTLFYEYSISIGTGKRKYIAFLRLLAILFIIQPRVDINDAKYTLGAQIKKYCEVCWRLFCKRKTWELLSSEFQGQLFRYLEDNKHEAIKILAYVRNLIKKEEDLAEEFLDCYYSLLKEHDVIDVEDYYVDKDKFLKRLYDENITGWQFTDHARFIELLEGMNQEDIDDYTPKQLRKLGTFVMICCRNNTFKAQRFVEYELGIWKDQKDFIAGIVIDCFSEGGNLKIKDSKIEYAFSVMKSITEERRHAIIEEIAKLPNKKPCKDEDECSYIRRLITKAYDVSTKEGRAFKAILDNYCVGES